MVVYQGSFEQRANAILTETMVNDRRVFEANAKILLTADRIRQIAAYALSGLMGTTGFLLFIAATYINFFTLVTPISIALLVASAGAAVFGFSIDDLQSNTNLKNCREEMHGIIDRMQRVEDTNDDQDNAGDKATLVTELRQTLGLWVERFGWKKMLTFGVPSPLYLRKLLILMGKHLSLEEIIYALRGFKEAFREIEQGSGSLYPYNCVPTVREFAHLWQPVSLQDARRYDLNELQQQGIVSEAEARLIRAWCQHLERAEATYLAQTVEERRSLEQFIKGPRAEKQRRIANAQAVFDNHPVHAQIATLRLREAEEIRRLHNERESDTRIQEHRIRTKTAHAALDIDHDSLIFSDLVDYEEAKAAEANRSVEETYRRTEAGITNRYKAERRRLIQIRDALESTKNQEIEEAERVYQQTTAEDFTDFNRQVAQPKAAYEAAIDQLNREFSSLSSRRSSRTIIIRT